MRALNAFMHDAYHRRDICRAGKIPEAQIVRNDQFLSVMQDFDLPGSIYAHICGIDVVRVSEGQFYVLEDNCRVPSGVSYMLENREVMMRLVPSLFTQQRILPVAQYAEELL
ncbi:circularly permuted type 2 ATP-grasp protein, partial [Elstera litoralis]|uniref:circularly permuted type 2 ATP-grasp protein n=1 Tax=Elstera litoralis TaxID=552518 RepID=UPI001E5B0A1C